MRRNVAKSFNLKFAKQCLCLRTDGGEVLFAQPRVEVTSCCVYKVMRLTFHDRINTQLIYRFELAQEVARRLLNNKDNFLGSNLTGCSFSFSFFIFIFIFGGGGGG